MHFAIGTDSFPLVYTVSSVAKVIQCCLTRACLVCDAVTLEELLELSGIVTWTVVTPDYIRLPQLSDNHRQFYAYSC